MGGAERHLTNFLPELGKADTRRSYLVLARESASLPILPENVRVERIPDAACASGLRRVIGDVFGIPARVKRERFSMVVSLTNFGPIWSSAPHVLFQRNSLYYSGEYFSRIGAQEKLEIILRRRLALESMRRAALIVTPSDSMATMIRDACPQVRSKAFQTLYHGLSPVAAGMADFTPFVDPARRTIIYPSHIAEHKGFRVLFQAVALLRTRFPTLRLVLTIGRTDHPAIFDSFVSEVERLGISRNIEMIGRVSQAAIWGHYRSAELMVYPSYCESFGFTMLEAMGAGLPIAAADTPVNREICGAAARYFDPFDPVQCAARIAELLVDPIGLAALCDSGRARLAGYDWSWRRYAADFSAMIGRVGSA